METPVNTTAFGCSKVPAAESSRKRNSDMWRNILEATGAACRRIWVVLVVALGLMTASCDKPGESEDEACDWPQPFDVAPGETAQVKASVAECSAEVDEYVDSVFIG